MTKAKLAHTLSSPHILSHTLYSSVCVKEEERERYCVRVCEGKSEKERERRKVAECVY